MRNHFLLVKVAALIAAAFAFSGCPLNQVKPDTKVAQKKQKRIDPSDIKDTTDFGGTIRTAELGCKTEGVEDPKVVYRYMARTMGSNARIDDYCVAPEFENLFLAQPPETHIGKCPGKLCGESTTSRRGPLEHAALQAVVSLEQSRSLELQGMSKAHENLNEYHDVNVHKDIVRFRLSKDIKCTSKLEVFTEHIQQNANTEADRIIAEDDKKNNRVKYFYTEGPTLTSGDIWYEQTRDGKKYKALLVVQSMFEGAHDSEMFKESILCMSRNGPIAVRNSPIYGFMFHRVSSEEWEVFSALVEPEGSKKKKKGKKRSKKKKR